MKICFFIQNLAMGGVIRQISILADHLSRRGHEISILALYPVDQNWKFIWELSSIEVSSLLLEKPSVALAPIELARATLNLRSLLKKRKIQILYSYEGNIARFLGWLATLRLPETKVVWGVQGAGQRNIREDYDWKLALPFYLCKWVSGFVPALISNSEAGYNDRREKGYRCATQLFIDNGFDVDEFKPDPQSRARVRSEWNLQNEYLIGVVGRIAPSKGLPTFLKAAALVAQQRKDVRFICIGSGSPDYLRQLRLLAQTLDLAEIMIWADAREDMAAVYNALDILCLAAYDGEGFPNVIGEAMACGVPCVVTNVGDSMKIVGGLGIVVPPSNPAMLADGLKTMLAKLNGINPLEIRDRIVRQFPLEAMVDKTEQVLTDVLSPIT
jgi:glycosyltransferase involved in cell wall biosynthesis